MDYFDTIRYGESMAAPTIAPVATLDGVATLDPVACCGSVRTDVLDQADAETLARAFTALSDPIRLRMLSAIAAERGEEVCACDLVELSGRSQPTVSHHMKILVDAGLVTREKRGLWVWYRIEPQRLDALRSVLT